MNVSVLMAAYNGDNISHFRQALASVINQDFSGTMEIIVSFDGPVDKEFENIVKNQIHNPKNIPILVVQNITNKGPANARNRAFDACSGEFVAIADADDVSEPSRISLQSKMILENNLDVLGSNYSEIGEAGEHFNEKYMPQTHRQILNACPFVSPIANPTAFFKRATLEEFKFDETLRFGEDYSLWIRLLLAGKTFGNHPESLVRFRRSQNFYNKRKGIQIAKADFINKIRAMQLVSVHKKPIVLIWAVVAFVIRLCPTKILILFYSLRSLLFKNKSLFQKR